MIMGSNGGVCINKYVNYEEKYNYCETTTNNWNYCSAGMDAYEAVAGLIIHVGKMVPNIPVVLQITETHGIITV